MEKRQMGQRMYNQKIEDFCERIRPCLWWMNYHEEQIQNDEKNHHKKTLEYLTN